MSKDVAIVMGSDSDWPTMSEAAAVLDEPTQRGQIRGLLLHDACRIAAHHHARAQRPLKRFPLSFPCP